nr:MAG TPA: hypothetical protein [Caudoviricetes sp.]
MANSPKFKISRGKCLGFLFVPSNATHKFTIFVTRRYPARINGG